MAHSKRRIFLITLIAWFSMIGFDFFLHAGLLAKLYLQPSPFLLAPGTSFALIPVGYLSFLLLTVVMVWLMISLNLAGWSKGALFGLKFGSLVWGSFILGLLSISTASYFLLLGWFIGQTLELVIAGVVIGSGLAGTRLRRLFTVIFLLVLLSVVSTIVLQSLGIVPINRIP